MARVYRHQYSGGRKSAKWYIEYRDHAGKLCREPAYRSKELSQGMLGQILERIEKIQAGVIQAHEGLPASPIAELLDRWEASQRAKGLGRQHCMITRNQVERVCVACNFFDARSLDAARAQDAMERLVADGLSPRTYQQYRASLMTFGGWLSRKEKILPINPFVGIDTRNIEIGRKIIRRVFSESEFHKFIEATRAGISRAGLSGEDRAWLYTIAAFTGFRLAACLALTPSHFNLGKSPAVTSSMSMQKNRKSHTVPLPSDLAAKLRTWMKDREMGKPLWNCGGGVSKKGARLVRFDLKAAGIEWKTSEGRIDFHSLRHYYATSLVRSGANPVEVQHLLDHSSPVLASRYFRHLKTDELRGAVNKLKMR